MRKPSDLTWAETTDKNHGRLETRQASASAEAAAWTGWPDAAQILRIMRRREVRGKVSTEITYYITSLPPDVADAGKLMALARKHWHIENRLHWRRDVSLREDQGTIRAGARTLACLRNHILALLSQGKTSVPAQREAFAANPNDAVKKAMSAVL